MGYSTTLRSTSERAEQLIGLVRSPIKPHLPAISRFLIVATFYEDAMRIILQWSDQVMYLEKARHFPSYIAPVFLGFNATVSWNYMDISHNTNGVFSPCYSLLLVLF